jgi:hypothetical protein
MRGTSIPVVLVCAGVIAAQARDSRQEVQGYLTRHAFDTAEIARLEAGEVVARAADGRSGDREISVVAAVKIRVPRAQVVSYLSAYQARGDAALVTYNDRSQPVSLKDQWAGIIANSPLFHEYSPELKGYLERFPSGTLPGARDVFYWIKENYGMAPVLSLVHAVIYSPPSRPDRTIVAQKQLYASHYYDGSLAIAALLDTHDAGQPGTYLVYANRSRGDLLKGGFGGLKRSVARSQARQAAEETLGNIKQMLESARQ